MKKTTCILTSCALLVSASTFASVKCEPELIKGVQVKKSGEVIYTSQNGIRRLAVTPENPIASQHIIQTLLKAVDQDYYIQSAFPNGYTCGSSDTKVAAEWIYVQNPHNR
ncbi:MULTISPECIES: hypothetical protein [Vibrio]|uniref:hypothetical protein n=1 Tax=Vibrio TaxID=662 RepID=UPI001EDE5F1A|nr:MULTISPECIES: hypothetical protein [Vibrio]MCG3740707.1 hypothetical protein [Vibrio cincinnatiensis]MCS0424359.1 hypothetical protein [Vibrio diabolicus]MCZ6314196.1 hypothetical protein [Vibrio parahaemolyticus]HDV5624516.1 hypothetical protein [Vibrio cholerae]